MAEKDGEIDWLGLSAADRVAPTKVLFKVMRHLATITGKPIDLLLDEALGTAQQRGTDYESNFRKGKIAAIKAKAIHKWVEQNHFDAAKNSVEDIQTAMFQTSPKSAWDQFVEQHAVEGHLTIKHLKQNAGLIERDDEAVPVSETLRLTQRFCFELETEIRGVALAFQKYEGQWHPLPLGADSRNPLAKVNSSPQILPHTADGKPIGLREYNDAGHHVFVVIVSDTSKLPSDMQKLATLKPSMAQLEVHQVAIRFVT